MSTRALAAAVVSRRLAGQSWSSTALTATTRSGGASNNSIRGAHAQAEEPPETVTAALNSKNVEELGARAATVLPDDVLRSQNADSAAWVPDQETGVFVPAEEAAADGPATTASSVLDQTVFNREEEMEDVERPAVDMADGA